jgi:hypothetical protein
VSEAKIGIEDLEKSIELAAKNVILGIEIGKDGINEGDLVHVPALFENVKELIEFISSKPNLGEEIKDLDPMEGFQLVKKAYDAYKQVAEESKA